MAGVAICCERRPKHMPDRNLPSPGHDADHDGERRAWWDRAAANEPWSERRAIFPARVAGSDDRAMPLHAGPAMVRISHLTRLAEALEESRRLQAPRISRDHLRLVREACE